MSEGKLTMVGEADKRPARIHHLVKAPANTPWALERKNSWDAKDPATVYYTPETLADGTPTTALTVILRTKGCHWWWSSGCTFCGYFNDTRDDVTSEDLHSQWEKSLGKFEDFDKMGMIKVYTSGSLFEDREIPVDFQERVLKDCYEFGKELVVESRTEQMTEEKLEWATTINPNFSVAIGLEAYDDEVLRFHVNKGFSIKSWDKAVENLRKFNLRVKTYLMFKPPFMSEGDALVHGAKWIRDVASRSDEISVNPMNIQRGTVIDRLFRANEYRPPWLWSLIQLIRDVHDEIHPSNSGNGAKDQICRLIIHPTAGGKVRGSHNCGKCDSEVVAAIERYSVSGLIEELDDLTCFCEEIWRSEVELDSNYPIPLGVGRNRRGNIIENLRSP